MIFLSFVSLCCILNAFHGGMNEMHKNKSSEWYVKEYSINDISNNVCRKAEKFITVTIFPDAQNTAVILEVN